MSPLPPANTRDRNKAARKREISSQKIKQQVEIIRSLLKAVSYFGVVAEREREMFYLTTHSTHFIYGYMASDIWLRTILIVRKETP